MTAEIADDLFDIDAQEKINAEKKANEQEVTDEEEVPPEKAIAELTAQLEQSRKAAEEANRRADEAEKQQGDFKKQATTAQEDAFTHRKNAVEALLKATETEIESAERLLEEALTTGDAKATVKAQKELGKLTYKYESVSSDKQKLEYWKEQQDANAQQAQNAPAVHPATQAWIAKNPRFNSDQEFKNEAVAADYVARQMGIVPNTPAYFKFVDERLDRIFSDGEEEPKPQRQSQQRLQSAPPDRGSANASGKRSLSEIKLSPAEKEAAADMDMSEDDYKKYKYVELPKRDKGKR